MDVHTIHKSDVCYGLRDTYTCPPGKGEENRKGSFEHPLTVPKSYLLSGERVVQCRGVVHIVTPEKPTLLSLLETTEVDFLYTTFR